MNWLFLPPHFNMHCILIHITDNITIYKIFTHIHFCVRTFAFNCDSNSLPSHFQHLVCLQKVDMAY